jgi:hypothetical protein
MHTIVVTVPDNVATVATRICTSELRFGVKFNVKSECKFSWANQLECYKVIDIRRLYREYVDGGGGGLG